MSDISSLLKYEEIKQQIELIQIAQKAYGHNYNISQTSELLFLALLRKIHSLVWQ